MSEVAGRMSVQAAAPAQTDPALRLGLSTLDGNLASEPVAEAHELPYTDPTELLDTR